MATKTATLNQSGGWTGTTCAKFSNTLPVFATVGSSLSTSTLRAGEEGDGHRPLPYYALFREGNHWDEVVSSTNHAVFPPGNQHKQCEPNAGRWESNGHVAWTLPLSDPSLPEWAGEKEFLRGMSETSAKASLSKSLMNVPLLIAERRQTAALLASYGRRIAAVVSKTQRESLVRYYKYPPNRRRQAARDIANEHLAVMFGLLPLVDEAVGAAELAARKEEIILTGRGARAIDSSSLEGADHLPSGLLTATSTRFAHAFHVTEKITDRLSCRTSLTCKVTVPALVRMRQVGFNPLATAYDLVPLSFLADFVSNLGTFIRSLDPTPGLEFMWGCSTAYRRRDVKWTAHGLSGIYTPSSGSVKMSYKTTGTATATASVVEVKREVIDEIPGSSLYFANNMSVGKAVTIGALAIQRYLKPVRAALRGKQFRYRGPRPRHLPPIKYRRY